MSLTSHYLGGRALREAAIPWVAVVCCAIGLVLVGGCPQNNATNPPSGQTDQSGGQTNQQPGQGEQQTAPRTEFENSVRFPPPVTSDEAEYRDSATKLVANLGISFFMKFGLGLSAPWLAPVKAFFSVIPSGAAGAQMRCYAKRETGEFTTSLSVSAGEQIMTMLEYHPGDMLMHANGLQMVLDKGSLGTLGVYRWSELQRLQVLTPAEGRAVSDAHDSGDGLFVMRAPLVLDDGVYRLRPSDRDTGTVEITVQGSVLDTDGDGTPDARDGCPNDPNKTAPGNCGCGQAETPDCGASTAKVYWSTRDARIGREDGIRRSSLDGTDVETLATMDCGRGIALDPVDHKMYWSGRTSQKIYWANFDGTGLEEFLSPGDYFGVALDRAGSKLYWTEISTSRIRRANLDGTGQETLVSSVDHAFAIALDVTGGKMYWASAGGDKVARANLDGSAVEDIIVLPDGSSPTAIAVDASVGKVYWSDRQDSHSRIRRANFDGSQIEDVVFFADWHPDGIALDVAGGHIYFAQPVYAGEDGRIGRCDLDGTDVETLVWSDDGSPAGIALDLARGE